MTEKICKTCKHLLTVTSTSNDVFFECLLAHPECASVDLTDTCKIWKPVVEDEKVKEMRYSSIEERNLKGSELLCEDNYKGYTFYIISHRTHPCAYILLDGYSPFFRRRWDELGHINCHGQITYSEDYLGVDPEIIPHSDDCWIIGWDYCHSGDRYGVHDTGKSWTTQEIYEECLDVIEDIISKS